MMAMRKKAFDNIDENPIWLNQEKGIKLKRVTIKARINNPNFTTYQKKTKMVI